MDYLFWRKSEVEEPSLDRDPYPWLIWYIWKARNDKLFRGIDRNPEEIVRYAESECKAWFDAQQRVDDVVHNDPPMEPQAVNLENVCVVDGSWVADAPFSGCGWSWNEVQGSAHMLGVKNMQRKESPLHVELEALRWAMECMLQVSSCQSFGTDCKDVIAMIQKPEDWPAFATELEVVKILQMCFPDFKISHVPRASNRTADFLARNARSFYRRMSYFGYSVPVWFPRPPQA